jgi:hypothetical protein
MPCDLVNLYLRQHGSESRFLRLFFVGLAARMSRFCRPRQIDRVPPWLAKTWIRTPAFALLSSFLGYVAFAAGFPSWYTYFAGSPGERITTVAKWRFHSRWRCSGPDISEAPWLSTICLSYGEAAKTPPGSKLLLEGSGTALAACRT